MHLAFEHIADGEAAVRMAAEEEYAHALVSYLTGIYTRAKQVRVICAGTDERREKPALARTLRKFLVKLRSGDGDAWSELFLDMYDGDFCQALRTHHEELKRLSPFRNHDIIIFVPDARERRYVGYGDAEAFKHLQGRIETWSHKRKRADGTMYFIALPRPPRTGS